MTLVPQLWEAAHRPLSAIGLLGSCLSWREEPHPRFYTLPSGPYPVTHWPKLWHRWGSSEKPSQVQSSPWGPREILWRLHSPQPSFASAQSQIPSLPLLPSDKLPGSFLSKGPACLSAPQSVSWLTLMFVLHYTENSRGHVQNFTESSVLNKLQFLERLLIVDCQ